MRRGVINKGFVKKTFNQEKKHFTQFSKEELSYLESEIRNLSFITPSWHLVEKKDILVKRSDILDVIKDSDVKNLIVEYNQTSNGYGIDKRVLLRSKRTFIVNVDGESVDCNLCFVISLIKKEVVTAYYNSANDNHETINWDRYSKDLKIV